MSKPIRAISIRLRKSNRALASGIAAAGLLVMVIASAEAGAELAPGLHTGLSITYQGIPRTYDVLVPASYDGSVDVPLLIDIHGYNRNKEFQRNTTGFAAVAEAEGFIVAWPQGWIETNGFTWTWNAGPPCTQTLTWVDDVGFIRTMVSTIGAQVRVDPHRIYATGLSCGGAMTHRLACEAGDLFAAVAPFSWDVPRTACASTLAMPILTTHSFDDIYILYPPDRHILDDPTKPILPGARAGFEEWRTRDGCTGSGPDVTENPGATSVCERYTNCRGGAEVGLCSVHTSSDYFWGHAPYSPLVLDGFNTQQWAWDFLSRFSLVLPEPGIGVALMSGLAWLAALRSPNERR